MKLQVKVRARGGRDEVVGWVGETLSVRVRAVPEDGMANAAVVRLVAGALGGAAEEVRLVAGAASTRKVLVIEGLDDAEGRRRLDAPQD